MKGTKAPALTSPWKIGFFVSLLLVAMAIGVGFLLTRTFGIGWTWIEFAEGSWKDFQFHVDGFLREMLPLILLVPIFSLFSYFLITGAVRKYKRYLDSGFDYKNLIQSIRGLDDLADEKAIKKLSKHPELKDLLLDVKKKADMRQAELADRERQINERAARVATEDGFSAEANVLLSAIISGRDGFGKELALSHEPLKKIENAIRDNLFVAGGSSDAGQLQRLLENFSETSARLRADLQSVSGDVTASENSAREIEKLAKHAHMESAEVEPDPARSGGASQAIGALDAVGQTLATVGEETRSLAINAAMQASNTGNSELVTIAEAMQNIASRLSDVATRWAQASETARTAIGGSAPGLAGSAESSGDSIAEVVNQASVWVERSAILSDKFKKFERRYSQACSDIEVQLGGHPQEPAGESDIAVDVKPAPAIGGVAGPDSDPSEANTGVFERQQLTPILETSAPSASDSDVDGLEKDPNPLKEVAQERSERDNMFTDIPMKPEAAQVEEEPAPEAAASVQPDPTAIPEPGTMFEEISEPSPEGDGAGLESVPAPRTEAPQAPADFLEPTSLEGVLDAAVSATEPVAEVEEEDGFVTDPAVAAHPDPDPELHASPEEEQAFQATAMDVDPERENAIDLFALGAVEYEPENALHNA